MNSSDYDSLAENLGKLPGEFKALIEKRIELFTLETGERISRLIANAIYRFTGILFISLGLILILFAASNFIGSLLDSDGLGFVIVATPILLIGLLLFYRRPRTMVIATRDKMLHQFMKDFSEQLSDITEKGNSTEKTSAEEAQNSNKRTNQET